MVARGVARAIGIGLTSAAAVWGQVSDGFAPDVNGWVSAIAVQPNGRIVIGGGFTAVGGIGRSNLARLQPGGALDSSFDPQANGAVDAVAVLDDGGILVGGSFTALGAQLRDRIVRLNSDGSLDPGFTNGIAGDYARVEAMALQDDGKILIGGSFDALGGCACTNLGRWNHDGSVDTDFFAANDGEVRGIAVQPDGKILVCGTFSTIAGQFRPYLARLNPGGSLDVSFVPEMGYLTNAGGVLPGSLIVQPDGKVLLAGGFFTDALVLRSFVRRFNPDGSADAGFYQPAEFGAYHPMPRSVFSMALQCDGGILAVGDFSLLAGVEQPKIGRLNPDGTIDSSFNTTIEFTNASSVTYAVSSVAVQADGRILAGGNFSALGGQAGGGMGRLTNGAAVSQALNVNASGTAITWLRTGAGPEVANVVFERYLGGTNVVVLGKATRVAGGWQLAGQSLPFGEQLHLRVRGHASGSLLESAQVFSLAPKIEVIAASGIDMLTLTCVGAPGRPCTLLSADNLLPSGLWIPVATNTPDGNGLVCFTGIETANSMKKFYRLRQ